MVEFDTNPKVRFELRVNNNLKYKILETAKKNHTKPSFFIETFLGSVDFENFNVLSKKTNILLPIDEDNYRNILIMTANNGRDMREYINTILRLYFEE